MYEDIGDAEVDQVAELVKIGNRINDKVKTYSLGMRQRVGLAQAILHRPKLLVLDEPTNGLDPLGIKELRDLLKYLAKEAGTGVLVSSHLLSEMELMCDRIYVIDEGKIIGERSIGKAQDEEHLESVFSYSFITSDNDRVYEIFKGMDANCDRKPASVSIVMKRKHIPGIIKDLMEKNIDIYAINQSQRSLEEEFLSMTNGTKKQIQ
jgi:ABC-2 type transport system ATP-binding protein